MRIALFNKICIGTEPRIQGYCLFAKVLPGTQAYISIAICLISLMFAGRTNGQNSKILPEWKAHFNKLTGRSILKVRRRERTMKKMLTFVLLSFLLAGCSRRDATVELAGTWTQHLGQGIQNTLVIAPDGSYQCRIVGLPNGRIDSSEGRLVAKNGVLIDTVTKDSDTNQQTPLVIQFQIVHIDKHQLVVSGNGATNVTFDKVER